MTAFKIKLHKGMPETMFATYLQMFFFIHEIVKI